MILNLLINDHDNFERVDVGVVPAGQYAVVITHKGTLTGSRQDYSLLITGRSNNVVACNAPSNATVTNITNNNATISWQVPTTATTGYSLEYKSASSNTWNTAYTGANTSSTLTNLAASTSYEYRVNANCGNNNISTFTTLANPTCAAPTNLVANSITISSATLTWAASTSANNGYTVSYKPSSSSNWTVAYTGTNTTISISNLSASTAYNWRVVTNCTNSLTSNPATSSFTTAGAPIECNTPTNAQVSNITYNSANISWTASSSTIQSYSLEYKLSTNTTWTTAYTGTNLNFVLSNLTANSTYNYRIKENCTSTNSSDYISGNFVTSQLPICNVPTNLTTTNITQNSANISWTAAVNGASSYTVEYKLASATNWTAVYTGANTSSTLNGLIAYTSYDWRVRSNCATGSSSDFVTTTFITQSAPVVTCGTAFEPNNNTSNATPIVINTNYQAAIATTSDVDYYKIVVSSGNYTINLTNLSHDIDVRLQNWLGLTIGSSLRSGTRDEQISGYLFGGTYYIRVTAYSGSNANTCYNLNVKPGYGVSSEGNSISYLDNHSPISIYPNPAQREVTLKLDIKEGTTADVVIYDLYGKVITSFKGNPGEQKIDISNYASGAYMMVVNDGNETVSRKFVKL